VNDAEVLGQQAEQSDWLDRAARVGLVSYGVVYLLVGWLAIQLALGDHSENASPQGALSELSQQPFGEALVWAVAVGLTLLVVWRVVEAGFGHREKEGGARVRARLTSAGKAVIYAALAFTAYKIAAGSGSSGSSDQKSKTMTAKVMDLPAGQWIVVAVGLAIIGYAVGVAWRGWKEKFAEGLETEGKLGYSGAAYLILGKVGHIAKGIAFAIVGALFVYAGISHDPGESGGLDDALQKVLRQPFGPFLLGAVAAGIICYGLFCFAWARHLDR
jgi:hypothetical protein